MLITNSFDDTYKRFNRLALEITLEAFEKSPEARGLGQKLGDSIPGSIYFRCFCIRCGTPMRCTSSKLFSSLMCRYCDPKHSGCSSPVERLKQYDKDRWSKRDDKMETHIVKGTEMIPLNFKSKMTKRQWLLYVLLHPQGSGLTIKEAAVKLRISTTAVFLTIQRIKKNCPLAFWYEREIKESLGCEYNAHNIEYVYEGYKAKAKQNKINFELPFDDFMNIIQLECFLCNRLPNEIYKEHPRVAFYRKTGFRFSYNYLWVLELAKGFTTVNCASICSECADRKKLDTKRKKRSAESSN